MKKLFSFGRRGPVGIALLGLACLSLLGQTAQPETVQPPSAQPTPTATLTPAEQLVAGLQEGWAAADAEAAELFFQNRRLAVMRANLLGYTPQKRVEGAVARLAGLVDLGMTGPVEVQATSLGNVVLVAGNLGFLLTEGDVDGLAGETLDQVTQQAAAALRVALSEAVEHHSFEYLLRAAILSAVATLIFVGLLVLLARSYRRTAAFLLKLANRKTKLVSGQYSFLKAESLARWTQRATGLLVVFLSLFLTYIWLTFCLKRFPYTRAWGETLGAQALGLVREVGEGFVSQLPGLFGVLVIVLITRLLVRGVNAFFEAVREGQIPVPETFAETSQPTRKLIVALLWIFALVMAYPYLPGSGTEAFKGVSVFLGLMVSLGSSSVISQGASGLILMYSRALRVGDYVKINETEGIVTSLGMLSTKVRSNKREEITIPNSLIVGTTTKNYTRLAGSEGLLVYTSVTIGYNTPWRQVHAMLQLAAERTPGLLREPRPFVLQTALSDFYVEYQLNALIEDPSRRIRVLSDLHAHIQDAFNEFGVQIMSPHYEADPLEPVVVPPQSWHEAPALPPDSEPKTK